MRVLGYLPGRRADLGLANVTEDGVVFATGMPVTFRYFRSTDKAPYLGSRFGQDIEPAGRYMLHVEHPTGRGEVGTITFENPLVLRLSLDPKDIYGPKGWKARLAAHFGATGRALSRRIRDAGYDGIVTVDSYGTSEIVDLKEHARARR